PLPLPRQEPAVPGRQIDRAETPPARVGPGDRHLQGLPPPSPRGTQRRQEQQVGFILEQLDRTGRQTPDFVLDPSLFSLAPGRDRGRSGVASTRSPTRPSAGGSRSPKAMGCRGARGGRAGAAPSIPPPGSRTGPGTAPS